MHARNRKTESPTLAELGLDRKRAMRDMTFAEIEAETFASLIATSS
jgi:hypothetical protein